MIARALGVLAASFLCGTALAVCELDGSSIANPDDPECRDTQLVFTESDSTGNNIALGYPVPLPVDSLTGVDRFRTYASLHARHQELLFSSAAVSGEVVGTSVLGREIWAYVVGDGDRLDAEGRTEPAVIVNGGLHAREWQSPEVLTEIFEQLVERADDASLGAYLHDELSIVLIPVLNVDGLIQTQRFPTRATADVRQPRDGRMRRKNMSHPSASAVDENIFASADNFFGVDLNRNSGRGFGQNSGSSADPVSLVYRGSAPNSEPEIRALLAAVALAPAERLRLGIDVHSFTRVYLAPRTGNARRDAITAELAERMRATGGFRYRYAPDPVGSGGIGTLADYFAYALQVPAWTLEIEPANGGQDYGGTGASHSGFVLPDSEIARVRDDIATSMLLGFYRQAGPPHVTAVEITAADTGAPMYTAQWVARGTARELEIVHDRALVPGREYRLWIAFDKPMRWYDDAGQLTNYPGQRATAEPVVFASADAGESFRFEVPLDDGHWLDRPGGAPDGYLNYRGDSLAVSFAVPATVADAIAGPSAVSLQLQFRDIAQMDLDADPATPVDWQDGHWSGYELTALDAADNGGADCTHVVFVSTDADAAAPDRQAQCPAFAAATAPPPAPAPTPGPAPAPAPAPASGGGGSALWLALLVMLGARRRDRG